MPRYTGHLKTMDSEETTRLAPAQEYADENVARALLESLRWPHGTVCPHCRRKGAYPLRPQPESRRPVRTGVWKCRSCRQQFTVRVGTLFEGSHLPFSKWVLAVSILCASRRGISSKHLERMLGISYKSAWSMSRRIRQAMKERPFRNLLSRARENDETYRRRRKPVRRRRGSRNKMPVAALV